MAISRYGTNSYNIPQYKNFKTIYSQKIQLGPAGAFEQKITVSEYSLCNEKILLVFILMMVYLDFNLLPVFL